jgi:hypothetical protein
VAGRMPLPAPEAAEAASLDTSIEELAASFDGAARATGVVERSLRIGEAPVRLRFAGSCLAEQLSRAFDHLVSETGDEPELTIDVWDSAESGTAPPPLPAIAPGSPRGTTHYTADDTRRFACRPALGQLSAYDREASRAWFWSRNARELPFWEPAAPFRQILHWWLPDRGALLLHGAAVGTAEGGVLLVGAGGSGKSTCALSALASDLLYAGDDYVGVALGADPGVLSLFCSGKLEPGHARLLPHLPAPGFVGDGTAEEKSVFYVAERFPERMCRGFPLRAIVAPRVSGAEPRLRPLGSAQALAALAPSTLLQLVPARQEALSAMARLLERIPAFGMDVGGPTELVPPALGALLQDLAA